jgi:ATP-dependent helicase/nuclease subunit B
VPRPAIFSIPPHVAFVDALAAGLIERTAGNPLGLAKTLVLLPNRRAVRALTEAFVRVSGGGLLLPRIVPIGDVDEDVALGSFADTAEPALELPPQVDDCKQRLLLTGLVERYLEKDGKPVSAVEALRRADELRGALRQLLFEEVEPSRLAEVETGDLAAHWQSTLKFLEIVSAEWPKVLAAHGEIDAARRRNMLLEGWRQRLEAEPPADAIVIAGMPGSAPLLGRLLGTVARLPTGLVVLPGVDLDMPDAEWDAIRCHAADADSSPNRDSEGHPQFQFRALLARMRVARGEIGRWRWTTPHDGPEARTAAVARAMAPAEFTDTWKTQTLDDRALAGVRLVETDTPGEEAQAIALAMRRQLDNPSRTAALITPDRALARRVAAHLKRWNIEIDDSAGTPLRLLPPGTLLLALAEAAAQRFAPVPLLALLKHGLLRGDARLDWLDRVRDLDLALRGVRPAPGLDGVAAHLDDLDLPDLAAWWADVATILEPLERLFARDRVSFPDLVDRLRQAVEALAGDAAWRGPQGRALAALVEQLETHGHHLDPFAPADAPGLLRAFLDESAVRPAFGRHPRLAIYGVLEARLQRADLLILGGLNEGVWPRLSSPDPWLAPAVRAQLGMPGLERNLGLAAHDLVQAMGAKRVTLTRSRRDASAPTVPSRLWLRLLAMGGDLVVRDDELAGWAKALDRAEAVTPAARPAPAPPAALRPRTISVTQVERLKADPYSFYASKVLGLEPLRAIDEDPTAAERGTFVHELLERWVKEAHADPARLAGLADLLLDERFGQHPLLMTLWAPRVRRMVGWVADEMAVWRVDGWSPLAAEAKGRMTHPNGITLTGKADRIDVAADGSLAIVDYKTGGIPSRAQIEGRFALQLGLLGWLAERGCFKDLAAAEVAAVRYWKLSGGKDPGYAKDPLVTRGKPDIPPADFIAGCAAEFERLCADMLLGDAPFTAKLHPEHAANSSDHDQLSRLGEWFGR